MQVSTYIYVFTYLIFIRGFQLFESEMKCVLIEAETRESVMREMEERMRKMEQTHAQRLMKEVRPYLIFLELYSCD